MTHQRLADRVGVLSLGSGLAVVVQLLLGVFLARTWSPAELASYLQVTMVVASLSPILFLGIPSSLYYFLTLYADERGDRILVQSYALLIMLGVGGALAAGVLAEPLAIWLNNAALAPAIRLSGLTLVGVLPAALAHPLLVSRHRYRAAALFVSGVSLAEAAVTAAGALAGLPLVRLVLATAAVQLLAGAVVGGLVIGSVGLRRLRTAVPGGGALLLDQLRYAVPFAASMHVGALNRFLDRYLIGVLYTPTLFAVYAVGAREVPVVPLVIGSVNIVLQQHLTGLVRKGRPGDVLPAWRDAIRMQALLVLPLGAVLWLLADPFITGLYSERYRDSVPVFRVYLGLLALRVATWPLVLTAVGRTRTLLAGSALALATNATVSLALVRPLGLLGPAVGGVAGALAAAVYYLVRTGALLGVPWRNLLPWSALVAVAGAVAGAGLALAPFLAYLDEPLPALLGVAAYGAAFVLFARAVGVLRSHDLALVRGWVRLGPARAPAR